VSPELHRPTCSRRTRGARREPTGSVYVLRHQSDLPEFELALALSGLRRAPG